ncbi:MAG: acyl-CoA dehydrogenase [Gammaproteobacteria bacterium]|nr:acyl-CoA dehydrogenase [Gammaproteobacteria bacterium]
MSVRTKPLSKWAGSTETREDIIGLAPARGAIALLDREASPLENGDPLPPLWHWFYFLPQVPGRLISRDGHPERGDFLPPVDLPRRMFAGSRMDYFSPLTIGQPAIRVGEVISVKEKTGKSGKLVFVTVEYRISQQGRLCIREEQDIVYKEAAGRIPLPLPDKSRAPVPEGAWSHVMVPDEVVLFRFSALTFNAHRIHYDRAYATNEEGYPGLVVHGPLTALMLAELTATNSSRRLTHFAFQGLAPLFDSYPIRLVGNADGDNVSLEAQGPDGKIAMKAIARLDSPEAVIPNTTTGDN